MNKKTILFLSFLGLGQMIYGQKQTGKVGINTSAPTEVFDVKGTARIEELPKNQEGKIYNGQDTKNTTFNATRTVVADDNGVLGYIEGIGGASETKLTNIATTSRYSESGTFTEGGGSQTIPNSTITLKVNEDQSTVVLDWVAAFIRTDNSQLNQNQSARSATMKISLSINKDGRYYRFVDNLAYEYFYQDAVPGRFSRTIPIKYTTKLDKGTYTFTLSAGLDITYNAGNPHSYTNSSIVGEGRLYK